MNFIVAYIFHNRREQAYETSKFRTNHSKINALHGQSRDLFVFVGILVATSALGNLFGTYMIRPIVNDVLNTGLDQAYIQIGIMALIFLVGVLSTLGYTQLMAVAAQKVVQDIRRDLFHIMQKLPLQFFDTHSHGELMSRFTNDVDTVSDALNNSFAMMIQNFIQMTGTLILLFVLSWRLSLVVLIFYVFMFAYIRFSSARANPTSLCSRKTSV